MKVQNPAYMLAFFIFEIMKNNWKKREGIVYSTNQEFKYELNSPEEIETLEPEKQNLKILLDKKHRNGKTVTIISGFIGTEDDLDSMAKKVKTKCGTGGSVKDGEIIVQGEFVNKIYDYLISLNYRVKKQ